MALQLCGWIKKGTDLDVEPFLNSLEQEGDWERAAAVALFNLDIRRAIQILNKGASSGKGVYCVFLFWHFVSRFFPLTELWKTVWKKYERGACSVVKLLLETLVLELDKS